MPGALGRRWTALYHAGGSDEFDDFVEPHLNVLRAIADREVGPNDAHDIVQETLLRAWQKFDTYSAAQGTPRVWLAAVLLDRARRERTRRLAKWRRSDDAAPDAYPPTNFGANPEVRLDIERAVNQLPPRQRQAVLLYYIADFSVQDVADTLNLRVGTVKAHLASARQNLRARMEQQ